MSDITQDQQGYAGWLTQFANNTDFLKMQTVFERLMARTSTATLVQVKAVVNKGEVKAVGSVDVLPLVKMQDGIGKTTGHGVVNNLPYFRVQGGADKAIIMDPKVGDIGVAVFADRDISSVKKNKKESQPGSFRRFDMADGMFFPCFLGGKPSCYLRFTDDNDIIVSPNDKNTFVTIKKSGGWNVTVDNGTTYIDIVKDKINIVAKKIFLVGKVYAGMDAKDEETDNLIETVAGPAKQAYSKPGA